MPNRYDSRPRGFLTQDCWIVRRAMRGGVSFNVMNVFGCNFCSSSHGACYLPHPAVENSICWLGWINHLLWTSSWAEEQNFYDINAALFCSGLYCAAPLGQSAATYKAVSYCLSILNIQIVRAITLISRSSSHSVFLTAIYVFLWRLSNPAYNCGANTTVQTLRLNKP